MAKTVRCSVATASLGDDRIVRIAIHDDARVSVPAAKECKQLTLELLDGDPIAVLIDVSLVRSVDKEARAILSSPSPELLQVAAATAIVVRSAASKFVANFFIGSGDPPAPTRIFTRVEEAERWLLQHLHAKL